MLMTLGSNVPSAYRLTKPRKALRLKAWAGAINLPDCCRPSSGQQWSLLYTLRHSASPNRPDRRHRNYRRGLTRSGTQLKLRGGKNCAMRGDRDGLHRLLAFRSERLSSGSTLSRATVTVF
jgi:hypothetical protein